MRGVGPKRAGAFSQLGLTTVGDLLDYLPFRYEHIPRSQQIGTLKLGQTATIVGQLQRVSTRGTYRKQSIDALLVDGTGSCNLRWFNSPHLIDKIRHGSFVRASGVVETGMHMARMTNPAVVVAEVAEGVSEGDEERFTPIYSATQGLPSRQISRVVDEIIDHASFLLPEIILPALCKRRKLPSRATAVVRCHRPMSMEDVKIARGRMAYEELLVCMLAMQLSRAARKGMRRVSPIRTTSEIDRRIRKRFPFELTEGQHQAVVQIAADLEKPEPMNRMLQADVGAGKTAVAVYAALTAIANKRQVALLAPTEVLANQHRVKVEQYLEGSKVRLAQLTGGMKATGRTSVLCDLACGKIDLLIGTHAMLEQDVQFADLGLVVIDEQHKFGVAQRAVLREKAKSPHMLVLSATPIPRTLAMTVFGDLDVSTISDTLPGRKPVQTKIVGPKETDAAWALLRERLVCGEQAYVVYPLVEESDSFPLKAASVEAKRLADGPLAGFEVGLMHGRLAAHEKESVMGRFRTGKIQALVSTTVIEVGVDVPNATVMAIQHAERYGLSQLHQLRGRIGRGDKPSVCMLFASSVNGAAAERLEILCATCDGFEVAEADLRLRGPGELLGTKQHGLPEMRIADLAKDSDLVFAARDDAAELLRGDPTLTGPAHVGLRREIIRRYGTVLKLASVG